MRRFQAAHGRLTSKLDELKVVRDRLASKARHLRGQRNALHREGVRLLSEVERIRTAHDQLQAAHGSSGPRMTRSRRRMRGSSSPMSSSRPPTGKWLPRSMS